jgi:Ca-activated chloride channel homolog
MGRLSFIKSLVVTCLAALAVWAQQQDVIIRTEVKLVRVLANVRDASGNLVGDLTKEDFEILDNGASQQVSIFERQTEQPLSVSLLIDISASTAKDLPVEIASLQRFVDEFYKEGTGADLASLYSFNDEVTLLSGFTKNKDQLKKSMRNMKAEAGTSLYDALMLAAPRLGDREGRRVFLIVTDGGDTTSKYTYQQALRRSHEAEAAIYSILIQPITNDSGRNLGGENALYTMAASTGGRVFHASVGPRLNAAFSDVLKALRTQYYLGYYPKNVPLTRNPFHSLEVRVKRQGLRAEARAGYYGDSSPTAPPQGEGKR